MRSRAKRSKEFGTETEYRIRDRAIAHGIDAKRVPMSGAMKGYGLDADIDLEVLLVEAKGRTPVQLADGKSISVKLAWWEKARREAALSGRPCAVWVHPKHSLHDFVLMDDDQFLSLVRLAIGGPS